MKNVSCGRVVKYEAAFFFSSGSRHTRWPRDWSSGVCSSDLSGFRASVMTDFAQLIAMILAAVVIIPLIFFNAGGPSFLRSEERRVGKECRPQGWPVQ